ncbi:MAG: bifunctional nuclease family protein [Bacteroidaceae bacterium]|nr:bifunctional nuclease family protein [Bacteroidaceae bacterium]MBR6749395.1 bifunctional nuclease family protein [Bacteroidaceae bacterium]
MEADRVKVTVLGISYSHLQQGAYLLVLAEEGGTRRVPVVVGTAEAQSIAIRLENLQPPRPMTHDLIANVGDAFGLQFKEVDIYRFENGIFYSHIVMSNGSRDVLIDSRTSDAVAIALRTSMPIYVGAEVMRRAGFEMSQLEQQEAAAKQEVAENIETNLERLSDAELEARKERAVAIEAYEEAALIQQILQKRRI